MDLGHIAIHLVGFIAFASIVLVLTQDIQIFPGVLFSAFSGKTRNPKSLPYGIVSTFIETEDGKRLEVWYLPAADDVPKQPYTAVVFHGNAGSLESFLLLQLWFQEQGIDSYSFDYRGFGKSSGWPNEKGIYLDSDAFWNFVSKREDFDPSKTIVCGFSVGAAPAARIASLHQPRLLILIAAFTDLKRMVKEQFFVKYLSPFVRYRLPTAEYVNALKETSLIIIHGENDSIVPVAHSLDLELAYRGTSPPTVLRIPDADHNNVFYIARHRLAAVLNETLRL